MLTRTDISLILAALIGMVDARLVDIGVPELPVDLSFAAGMMLISYWLRKRK